MMVSFLALELALEKEMVAGLSHAPGQMQVDAGRESLSGADCRRL